MEAIAKRECGSVLSRQAACSGETGDTMRRVQEWELADAMPILRYQFSRQVFSDRLSDLMTGKRPIVEGVTQEILIAAIQDCDAKIERECRKARQVTRA